MRRYVTAINVAVTAEVVSELDSLARFNSVGVLTQTSRDDIRRALNRAARKVRNDDVREAKTQATRHIERMRRVSLDGFREQIEGLTDDPDRADEFRSIAEEADSDSAEDKAIDRNHELVDSILDEAIEKIGDRMISELEKRGTHDERRENAADEVDLVIDETRRRADRIAAWETESINTEYLEVWNLANGIESYTWIDMDDKKVRPLHQARDGLAFQWDDPPDEVPLDGHAGIPPGCRCIPQPILS